MAVLTVPRTPTVVRDAVRLGMRGIAMHLNELVPDEMHRGVEVRQRLLYPVEESLDRALVRGVVVVGSGPVARPDELDVHSVDAPRVADEDVPNLLLRHEFVNIHDHVGYAAQRERSRWSEQRERK